MSPPLITAMLNVASDFDPDRSGPASNEYGAPGETVFEPPFQPAGC
ncbi:hypothetical protein [Streptomyces sp. AC602_WCS936]|nr:hypothetical protein [Streptomyces sp. AC602_WCS936]